MYLACSVNLQDKLSYQYSHHLFRAHVPANVNASLHSVEYWKTLKKKINGDTGTMGFGLISKFHL